MKRAAMEEDRRRRVNDRLNNLDDTREQLGGIGRTLMHEIIASGELASIKLGRRRMVPQSAIDDYIARRLAS